ncbi:MAG TPA: hypothetical protein PKC96_00485 [Bacilli bacterium]|nr:hypothetical protein [Bacilli bacterium]
MGKQKHNFDKEKAQRRWSGLLIAIDIVLFAAVVYEAYLFIQKFF